MSKVRLISPAFKDYSGLFGMIEFKNGVSVYPLSPMDKRRLGAITRVVDAEDGRQVGAAVDVRVRDVKAPSVMDRTAKGKVLSGNSTKVEKKEAAKEGDSSKYTREELEEVADKSGFAGLREIGTRVGVKHTSIVGMINALLKAGATKEVLEGKPDDKITEVNEVIIPDEQTEGDQGAGNETVTNEVIVDEVIVDEVITEGVDAVDVDSILAEIDAETDNEP